MHGFHSPCTSSVEESYLSTDSNQSSRCAKAMIRDFQTIFLTHFQGTQTLSHSPSWRNKRQKQTKKWLNLKGWWVKQIWKTSGRLRPIAWHLKCKVTVQQILDRAHTQMWHQASGGETFIYMCVRTGSSSSIPLPMNIDSEGLIPPPKWPRSHRLMPQNVTTLVLMQQMDITCFPCDCIWNVSDENIDSGHLQPSTFTCL